MTTLNEVKRLYANYLRNEFNEDEETIERLVNNQVLDLMFTTVGDDELEVQVSYDTTTQECVVTLIDEDGVTHENRAPQTLLEFEEELEGIDFNDYYCYAHRIVENVFGRDDIEF